MADSYRFAYYNNVALGLSSFFNLNNQPINTNWLDEITNRGTAKSNFLSISGGSDNVNYYIGYTNYQEEGILTGTRFERNNFNTRTEAKLLDNRLKISNAINFSIINNTPKPLSAFTNAYKQSPLMPVKYSNDRWGMPFVNNNGFNDLNGIRYNNVANPVAQLNYTNEQNRNFTIFGSISAEYKFSDNFKYTSNFGATYDMGKGYTFIPSRDIWLSQNPTQEIFNFPINEPFNILNQRKSDNYSWNWDNFVSYSKEFGLNTVNLTAGMSRTTRNNGSFLSGTRLNVPDQSNYWYLDFSTNNTTTAPGAVVSNSQSTPIVSIAYFVRGDYEINNKYLFSASIRREGISSFQESERWGVFPAVSAGWVVSNEDFFKNIKDLNYFKLRGGYGEVANGNTGNALNNLVFASGFNYAFGPDQQIFPGSNIPYQVDPNLSWETMKEIDLGFDFKMFDYRLTGTFDLYNRNSTDVILPVSLPPVLSPGSVYLNTGTVSNRGIELTLRWEDDINDQWKYAIGGNFSINKNELKDVSNAYFSNVIGGGLGNGQFTKQVLVGEPLGTFYVYEVTGLDGDGAFTYSDERVNAGSYLPTFTYGVNLALFYRSFDFSADLFGVGGNKIYNGKKAQRFGGENIESAILDNFWTPSTPNAENPRPFNDVPVASTYFVEDGSFLRVNNITFGYSFPKFYDKIDKVRVYATAVNPFIFTNYTGYSPEVSGNNNGNPLGSAGIELDAYPTNRTFFIGLNVAF
jgi:TonB-linked SusC/RagA family outer membrane protein